MTELIVKLFIKSRNTEDAAVREKYGLVSGIVGGSCNLLLFCIKFFAGLITGAVSIMADAFNNLSDVGSNLITTFGFKLANKPADPEHPFGHGRMEYMSASLVSVLIMLVGFELLKSSIDKLMNPETINPSGVAFVIIISSIAIKLWMGVFNRKMGKAINSKALMATSIDCLSDCISTTAVLISMLIVKFVGGSFAVYIDPIVGIAVAGLILFAGFKNLKETIDPLVGMAPEKELVDGIKETVLNHQEFLGIHDMIIHNYGPGRSFVSLHVEVDYKSDILYIHECIDACEREISEKHNIEAVIHMDPIVTDDEQVSELKDLMSAKIKEIDQSLSMHDFRFVRGEKANNLIFDVVLPSNSKMKKNELISIVCEKAREIDCTYNCVITVDTDFTGNL